MLVAAMVVFGGWFACWWLVASVLVAGVRIASLASRFVCKSPCGKAGEGFELTAEGFGNILAWGGNVSA